MFYNTVQLSALFNVPGGTSTLGFPATVTVPGFDCDVIGDGYHVDARLANHLRPTVVIAQILSCVNITPATGKCLTAFFQPHARAGVAGNGRSSSADTAAKATTARTASLPK